MAFSDQYMFVDIGNHLSLCHWIHRWIAHQSLNGEGKVDFRDADVQKILSLLLIHCESEEGGTD
jgi:hypothetical protein